MDFPDETEVVVLIFAVLSLCVKAVESTVSIVVLFDALFFISVLFDGKLLGGSGCSTPKGIGVT